jgi:hypothetical protein
VSEESDAPGGYGGPGPQPHEFRDEVALPPVGFETVSAVTMIDRGRGEEFITVDNTPTNYVEPATSTTAA